mmetsp:Transcript_45227/g.117159  ORF Transcript_45227/g.117159 Transcript_45227/m.117159 type:complete len:221 (+) Transcript_45227:379-1041(+)
MAVFVVHARQPAQQVDRGLVNQRLGGGGRSVGTDLRHADGCGGFSGGLILLGLQGQEDVGRGVERAAPDDAQLGEVQHQQCDARLQAALADGVLHVLHCLQRERPVLLELDEEDGLLVVSAHRLGLLIQPPAVEGLNQVGDGLALHADVWSEDVIAHLERDRLDVNATLVQHRRQAAHKLADVHHHRLRALVRRIVGPSRDCVGHRVAGLGARVIWRCLR